jgi:hypothetical protein
MVAKKTLNRVLFEGVEKTLAMASWSVFVYPEHRTGRV